MIKAVFIDIDSTLLNSKREITDVTKKAIEDSIKNGIKIILASGRSREITLNYQKMIGTSPYLISSNGADVYGLEEKEIYNRPIKKETVKKLFNYAKENNYKINFNYGFELAMNEMFYPDEKDNVKTEEELEKIVEKENVVQCVMLSKDIEKIKTFKQYLNENISGVKIENESKGLKNPNLKPSTHYFCDITELKSSKGRAVQKLCEYLQIKNDEIVTIGDGKNDISMFKLTKNSVAMGNSNEDVKKMANYVTSSNDEDGVAKVLQKILEQKLEC